MLGIQMDNILLHGSCFGLTASSGTDVQSLSLVPRLNCPAIFALWKNTGREPRLLGASHDITYVT